MPSLSDSVCLRDSHRNKPPHAPLQPPTPPPSQPRHGLPEGLGREAGLEPRPRLIPRWRILGQPRRPLRPELAGPEREVPAVQLAARRERAVDLPRHRGLLVGRVGVPRSMPLRGGERPHHIAQVWRLSDQHKLSSQNLGWRHNVQRRLQAGTVGDSRRRATPGCRAAARTPPAPAPTTASPASSPPAPLPMTAGRRAPRPSRRPPGSRR